MAKLNILYPGYYIRITYAQQLRISVKWTARHNYYEPDVQWAADQWSHVTFTWAAEDGIRAYFNGCDMDANDSKGYAYPTVRYEEVSRVSTFFLGAGSIRDTIAGTTMDELCIWHELLSSNQIWQFYTQGGICVL